MMAAMIRRQILHMGFVAGAVALPGFAGADSPKVQSLDDALHWLDRLEKLDKNTRVASTTAWTLAAVFEHLAQSIEMSLDGFPEPRSALFQNTAGAAAFTFFKWRGKMSHGLTEPILGAPALAQIDDWRLTAPRLRAAIMRFSRFNGALKPHFAYGHLSREEFSLAHAFHIANHQDEIVVG